MANLIKFISKFGGIFGSSYGIIAMIVFLVISLALLQVKSLKDELKELSLQLTNVRTELILCNADKNLARANIDLQNEKIKALEIENIDLKKIKSELQSIKNISTPKLGVCESELTYYKRLFGELNK